MHAPPLAANDNSAWGMLSYTSAGTYDLTLSASDGVDTVTQVVIWIVANVNRAPEFADAYTFSIAENAPVNDPVGAATATDAYALDLRHRLRQQHGKLRHRYSRRPSLLQDDRDKSRNTESTIPQRQRITVQLQGCPESMLEWSTTSSSHVLDSPIFTPLQRQMLSLSRRLSGLSAPSANYGGNGSGDARWG